MSVIVEDNNEEWLTVLYKSGKNQFKKQLQRFCKDIKPVPAQTPASKSRAERVMHIADGRGALQLRFDVLSAQLKTEQDTLAAKQKELQFIFQALRVKNVDVGSMEETMDGMTKALEQREVAELRPFKRNVEAARAECGRYTSFRRDSEYLVFGFVRRLERTGTRTIDFCVIMCLQSFADHLIVDVWDRRISHVALRFEAFGNVSKFKRGTEYERMSAFGRKKITGPTSVSWKLRIDVCENAGRIYIVNTEHRIYVTLGVCPIALGATENKSSGQFTNAKQKGYGLCADGNVCHASSVESKPYYKKRLRLNDVVQVHLDLIAGTLSFSVNGEFLGVAFDGIDCSEVYRLAVTIGSLDTEIQCIGRN